MKLSQIARRIKREFRHMLSTLNLFSYAKRILFLKSSGKNSLESENEIRIDDIRLNSF